MNKSTALAAGVMLSTAGSADEAKADRPNLLIIMSDDATFRDLEIYGGQGRTPNLNRLVSEGMLFTRCFQASPMCAPTRMNLYTGIYPVKSGGYPNHGRTYDDVRSITHHLGEAGYRVGLAGKWHVMPRRVFDFEDVPGFDSSCTRNPTLPHTLDGVKEFVTRSTEEPFCLVVALVEPHSPWVMGNSSDYPPDELELPPVFVDTPQTREAYSRYMAEITYMDDQVGDILRALDETGAANDTLVLYLSEQGSGFPYAKWTLYDAGVQSAAVVRWPGKVAPGSVSDAMIEYVDVVPTFIDAAGAPIPDDLDGRSFLPVLLGHADTHKSHVYGVQTTRGVNNGSEYYGIRSVRSGDYLYIRNLTPDAIFQCAATRGPVWNSWVNAAEAGDAHARRITREYMKRPAEELYDVRVDPWHRANLIDREDLQAVRDELRAKLDAWMEGQGDKGQATEMRALERMGPDRIERWRPSEVTELPEFLR